MWMLAVVLAACGTAPQVHAEASMTELTAAVAHPERPDGDTVRDAGRRPAEVLDFFEVRPGLQVAELMAGSGYYVEILAYAVGPSGGVYAHNNAYVLSKFADGPLSARLERLALPRVHRVDAELEAPGLPAGQLDLALMVLFYHDSVWMETDRAVMNRAVFDALKPGGIFGVVDHHAQPGSGTRDVRSIHRIDRQVVVDEVVAAGFVLEAESDLLAHPEDMRTGNVFDDALRGRTDRFVLRFRKPG